MKNINNRYNTILLYTFYHKTIHPESPLNKWSNNFHCTFDDGILFPVF